jgi:hypothetical protein
VTSRLARLGVASTNKSLSSLEHGAGIDVAKLPELAAALDCTVTWLLGLTDDPHQWEPDTLAEDARHSPAPPRTPVPDGVRRSGERIPGPWILGPLSPEP